MLEEFPSEEFSEVDDSDDRSSESGDDPTKVSIVDEKPRGNFALIFAGEASPWAAYGVQYCAELPESYQSKWAPASGFLIAGAGKFRQAALKHAGEELNLHVATDAAAAGFFTPMSRLIALRYGIGVATFTGSFTQRGTDILTAPGASDLLGSGFAGSLFFANILGVIGWQNHSYRIEFVPVGFRIPLWSRFHHDTNTPHEAAINRYLSGAGIFGLVNLGLGVLF